jgi:hypothetical protein
MLANSTVSGQDRLMEIFERVMSSRATTRPLHDDWEVRIGGGNADNLTNAIDGTGLESDVLDAGSLETLDNFDSLFRGRDTSSDAETFDRKAFFPHLLPERELEGKLTRVDIQGIESDTNTSGNEFLNFGDLGAKGSSVVVTTAGQLDMISGVENSADEARLDSRGRHTSDHDWGFT